MRCRWKKKYFHSDGKDFIEYKSECGNTFITQDNSEASMIISTSKHCIYCGQPLNFMREVHEEHVLTKEESLSNSLNAERAKSITLLRDRERMIDIFKWLLGYTDFPEKKTGDHEFYWRHYLRDRLYSIGIDILPGGKDIDPESKYKEWVDSQVYLPAPMENYISHLKMLIADKDQAICKIMTEQK